MPGFPHVGARNPSVLPPLIHAGGVVVQALAKGHVPIIDAATPSLSNYGCELFTSDALALETLFKTPWWANFYAREILTLHADFQRASTVPFRITAVCQGKAWAVCGGFDILSSFHSDPFPYTTVPRTSCLDDASCVFGGSFFFWPGHACCVC